MRNPDAPEAARLVNAPRLAEMCDERSPGFNAGLCDEWRPRVAEILRGAPVTGSGAVAAPRPAPQAPAKLQPLPPRRLLRLVNGCPARERCGCQHPRCHDPDFGPRHGYPDHGDWRVAPDDCLACVARLDRGLPAPRG